MSAPPDAPRQGFRPALLLAHLAYTMSNADATPPRPQPTPHPLSWPPPGLERLQGHLWRAILISWAGSVILVLPLLWALAVEQPFY